MATGELVIEIIDTEEAVKRCWPYHVPPNLKKCYLYVRADNKGSYKASQASCMMNFNDDTLMKDFDDDTVKDFLNNFIQNFLMSCIYESVFMS